VRTSEEIDMVEVMKRKESQTKEEKEVVKGRER
jgi:hypothetical protein